MRFKDAWLEAYWLLPAHVAPRIPPDVRRPLYRRLQMLDAACKLSDLRIPPGNRLEKLKGSRDGQYSIRVNRQWRLCFSWKDGEAYDVELCDYHS